MARGSKRSYTSKQRRQAHQIEESEQKRGRSPRRAKPIAYATVNKQDGGGKQSDSGKKRSSGKKRVSGKKSVGGRGRARSTSSSRKGRRAVAKPRRGRKD